MRNNSGPYFSQRALSFHNSAGWIDGINSSCAPALAISSRIIASVLRNTFSPIGSQVYRPDASRRIRPARSIN